MTLPVLTPMPRNISGTFSALCFSRSSSIAICICTAQRIARRAWSWAASWSPGNTTMMASPMNLSMVP